MDSRALGNNGTGLSPRVRGNHEKLHDEIPSWGSIPACAGEPHSAGLSASSLGVYPRVCGGTGMAGLDKSEGTGLSPRVRGNLSGFSPPASSQGSIPACAGEPGASRGRLRRWWVYPRVCGGTQGSSTTPARSRGLSPRVRGNRTHPPAGCQCAGSIPACAGEPLRLAASTRASRVYPRVCGGTATVTGPSPSRWGLSPRVRGNRPRKRDAMPHPGSIPACAGEPDCRTTARRRCRVYPRVCGGTNCVWTDCTSRRGLSPRVRGNPRPERSRLERSGSIPACAGEPAPAAPGATFSRVYPRVCGGTHSESRISARAAGLSPRVRGNPRLCARPVKRAGSIPACAGEPLGSKALKS